MCGFPLIHLDKYLKILVQQNRRFVALCEEFPRISNSGSRDGFDRRVSRIVTPGTLIDESFLNPHENNYLLALSISPIGNDISENTDTIGLAWIDISTGEFSANSCTNDSLLDELARICPKEVVLDLRLASEAPHPIQRVLLNEGYFISYITSSGPVISSATDPSHESPIPPSSSTFTPIETMAVNLLTTFLRANLLDHMPKSLSPLKELADSRMQIDSHTIKALEIRESMAEGGTRGSLLSVIKRTVTNSGTRLLSQWLCEFFRCFRCCSHLLLCLGSPSTSIADINNRQSLVSFFYARLPLREDLSRLLKSVKDVMRISQRLSLDRGDSSDLASIHETIGVWDSIKQRIELEKKLELSKKQDVIQDDWIGIENLMSQFTDLSDLANTIGCALPSSIAGESSVVESGGPFEVPSVMNEVTSLSVQPRVPWSTWRYGQERWVINPGYHIYIFTAILFIVEVLQILKSPGKSSCFF
jgi:DNA mismatch repair ATPase MutS